MTTSTKGDVRDLALAKDGVDKIEWAANDMQVLLQIRERFAKEKPLDGLTVAACLHITSETANLLINMRDAGAEVVACASNPLSTQDEVAAALVSEYGIPTYAITGEDNDTYYSHIDAVLDYHPQIIMDDGADLTAVLHTSRSSQIGDIIGGCEETTTGVIRLESLHNEGRLKFPIVAVNEADTKHFFDNRYGTGQSTIDGITRATNVLWAGRNVVVCGYGWCGRGVAARAAGLGAHTIVTEVDPIRAIEAVMDGHRVMPMMEASKIADVVITLTGGYHAIGRSHYEVLNDGAMLANSGHFDVEIDIDSLEEMSESKTRVRPMVDEYLLKDGRRIYLLGEGRLINLAAGDGHPSAVMDMSFANQALSVEYLAKNGKGMGPQVIPVPKNIDREVGRLKLQSMGIGIDDLTAEQDKYLASWDMGT